MKSEKFKYIEEVLEKERSVYLDNIKLCFDLMEKAYERLFKLQFNLGTFSLVGLFTIYSWNKLVFFHLCEFELGKWIFFLAVILNILELCLLCYMNELSTRLQVLKQELHKSEFIFRQEAFIKLNETLPDNSAAYFGNAEITEIQKKLEPYISQINSLSPWVWKVLKVTNIIFYITVIITTVAVLINIKI